MQGYENYLIKQAMVTGGELLGAAGGLLRGAGKAVTGMLPKGKLQNALSTPISELPSQVHVNKPSAAPSALEQMRLAHEQRMKKKGAFIGAAKPMAVPGGKILEELKALSGKLPQHGIDQASAAGLLPGLRKSPVYGAYMDQSLGIPKGKTMSNGEFMKQLAYRLSALKGPQQ